MLKRYKPKRKQRQLLGFLVYVFLSSPEPPICKDSDNRIALIVALHFLPVYLVSRPMAKQTISIDCKHIRVMRPKQNQIKFVTFFPHKSHGQTCSLGEAKF